MFSIGAAAAAAAIAIDGGWSSHPSSSLPPTPSTTCTRARCRRVRFLQRARCRHTAPRTPTMLRGAARTPPVGLALSPCLPADRDFSMDRFVACSRGGQQLCCLPASAAVLRRRSRRYCSRSSPVLHPVWLPHSVARRGVADAAGSAGATAAQLVLWWNNRATAAQQQRVSGATRASEPRERAVQTAAPLVVRAKAGVVVTVRLQTSLRARQTGHQATHFSMFSGTAGTRSCCSCRKLRSCS